MKILTNEKMVQYIASIGPLLPENEKKPKRGYYLNCVCAFDIETSVIYPEADKPQSIMYIWQFACNDMVTYGRTWRQYANMINDISKHIPDDTKLLCYVHNLSYEFQWLSGIFNFSREDVFCIQPRKILYARTGCIEYRCSLLLSNDSLAGFCEKHHVEHVKQSGEVFNYEKVRYPWTPLTNYEYKYSLYDVVGLVECIYSEMKLNGDNLYTIPYTSTGYVRRDVKKVLYQWNKKHQYWLQPKDEHIYKLLKECFRGGNTHANRFFSNQTLKDGPYWSYDISSSYPTQMTECKYPMSEWREGPTDWRDIVELRKKGYCFLFAFSASDVQLCDTKNGFPPLSESKCRNLLNAKTKSGRIIPDDNGRVLCADYLETTMTDVDFDIFVNNYDANITFIETYYCIYRMLPKEFRDYIKKLYIDKTALKGVEDEQLQVRYMQSKARINACYGLMVQDQIKSNIEYIDGEYIEDPEFDIGEALEKNRRKAYLSYSWGCWVTAWARKALQDAIDETYKQGAYPIYCDTDSVKGWGVVDFTILNKHKKAEAVKYGLFANDVNGKKHYMGVYEKEHDMDELKTLGAKKYAYTINGETYITIAGVNKKNGARFLNTKGGIDSLREGFIFKNATIEAVYNDSNYGLYEIDGRKIFIIKNVALIPNDYTMGITQEYSYILEHPEIFYDVWRVY